MLNEIFESSEIEDFSMDNEIIMGPVVLKKDFGPWKKGQKLEGGLLFNIEEGYFQEFDMKGNKTNRVSLQLVAS